MVAKFAKLKKKNTIAKISFRLNYSLAWKVITSNGSLVDAIVAGCSTVEEDRSVTSVGWGGRYAEVINL